MIKEIIIRNYKIFKGLHKINLSENNSAPVTIISTITASGKTTLIDAVHWCLYGKPAENSSDMLNIERQREMMPGEIETVEVEIVFSHDSGLDSFSRSIAFKNQNDQIVRCMDLDRCSLSSNVFPRQSFAPALFLSDAMGLTHSSQFLVAVKKMINDYYSLYNIFDIKKQSEIVTAAIKNVATVATSVFNKLYFRFNYYEIVWDNKFRLLNVNTSQYEEELSSTDQLVFNIAILCGIRQVLLKKVDNTIDLPLFLDDIFMRVDQKQFSMDKLIQALPTTQVIVLANESSLAAQPIPSYCGAFYYMTRNTDWTNVKIVRLH